MTRLLSDDLDEFGVPLVEMANLRPTETGLPYSIHIRSKEEVERTFHKDGPPTLKVYPERPGGSVFFSVTISATPEVIQAHQEREFYRSMPKKELSAILDWITLNHEVLKEFWDHGGGWFEDERKAWGEKIKRSPQDKK